MEDISPYDLEGMRDENNKLKPNDYIVNPEKVSLIKRTIDKSINIENNSSPVEAQVGMPSENSFGQWIDGEYKLPDDGEEVIFVNPDGHIRIGEFSDDEFLQGYWVNKCEQYLTKSIKRWMPLPKL